MKIRERLLAKFHDKKYRHTYVDAFTDSYLATQIQVLREQRELNQTQLADLSGLKQSQISAFEDVNNSSWTIRTLKKLAKAFDLVLVVKFESFGKVLPDIESLNRPALQKASFNDDPVFAQQEEEQPSEVLPADAVNQTRQLVLVSGSSAQFALKSYGNAA